MHTVVSKDGTIIAFDRYGTGRPLILVDGALCYRDSGPSRPLASLLQKDFTVYTYDRRGRGDSGNTSPYAVEREIEDIEALLIEAGGSAYVYGISSGAGLALEAANSGLPVRKLALYEAPFVVDHSRPPVPKDFQLQLENLIAAGDRGGAVRLFLTKGVRVPAPFVAMMRFMPAWPKLKGVAHTLPYDIAIVGPYQHGTPLPARKWSSATMPTLVAGGGKSPGWMRNAMEALADAIPRARHLTVPGQTHMVKPEVLAPVLVDFFYE
jgi:pimeloyl-ACP methyl ester carboxylesterase